MTRSTLISLAGSLAIASAVSAQQPGRQAGDSARAMRDQPMARATMMARMDSAETRLDRMVSDMNRATGARKIQAMSAVINELVAQRKQMRGHMQGMMNAGGMMEHGAKRTQSPAMREDMLPPAADTARAQAAIPDTAGRAEHRETPPEQAAMPDTTAQHPDLGPAPARADTAERSQPADSAK